MRKDSDRALLRRFEPIVRYTQGERFFPMDVDSYVRSCSLWKDHPGGSPKLLVRQGELTLEKLARFRTHESDTVLFLKFVDPVSLAQVATYRMEQARKEIVEGKRERFSPSTGRLARVGYLSRFVDALFSLSLLARGRIPGDTAIAAAYAYERILADEERYVYYGRVLRQHGWVVLQYWFFYPFNDWRTGFFGVNDHEADWELICIYLWEDGDGALMPEWTAYASHDYSGDDLRRRWDDPYLEKVGEHPVVYANAGSHASTYMPGEYLAELDLSFLSPVGRMAARIDELRKRLFRQGRTRPWRYSREVIIRVPFVDYAYGDGLAIGPGQEREWDEPRLLEPVPEWALHYRGLWGYYARDPVSGEDAPAGPLYNRDGSMRLSWHDPVAWAGLLKEPLPGEALRCLQERKAEIERQSAALQEKMNEMAETLRRWRIETLAMEGHPHLKGAYAERRVQMEHLSGDLREVRERLLLDAAVKETLESYEERLEAGHRPPAHAHLHRPHLPMSEMELRLGHLADTWAAISIGLAMIIVIALIFLAHEHVWKGFAVMVGVIVVVEAGFRRRLQQLITAVTIALAAVAALIIVYEFFLEIVAVVVLLTGGYILVQNLRELWFR